MPVGKGSLVRASKVNTKKAEPDAKAEAAAETITAEAVTTEAVTAEAVDTANAPVIKKRTNNIHENKFEAVSNIKSDLPVYLL